MNSPPSRITVLLGLFLAALILLALAVRGAPAESTRRGGLISALDGSISPKRLPRDHTAPAALRLSGALHTVDHSEIPRVRGIELALAARGGLDTDGLPTCGRHRLLATTTRAALAACGPALVGHGRLDLAVELPAQPRFAYRATLLAFNARLHDRRALLLHVYGRRPPASFVLPVTIARGDSDFPTALRITIPDSVGPWPHLARFGFTLHRRFTHRGTPRSYLNASCPLPPRFTAGIFPFARATYTLADRTILSTTIVRGCRAAGSPPSSHPHTSEPPARKRGRGSPPAGVPSRSAAVRSK